MRDVSKAATDVFQPRQPMTGRQLGSLLTMVGATGGAGVLSPIGTGLALGAGALPYLPGALGKTARAVTRGETKFQQAIRQAERAARRTLTAKERESVARFLQTMGVAAQNEQE
jgi:hypothetical protein